MKDKKQEVAGLLAWLAIGVTIFVAIVILSFWQSGTISFGGGGAINLIRNRTLILTIDGKETPLTIEYLISHFNLDTGQFLYSPPGSLLGRIEKLGPAGGERLRWQARKEGGNVYLIKTVWEGKIFIFRANLTTGSIEAVNSNAQKILDLEGDLFRRRPWPSIPGLPMR